MMVSSRHGRLGNMIQLLLNCADIKSRPPGADMLYFWDRRLFLVLKKSVYLFQSLALGFNPVYRLSEWKMGS